MSSSCSLCVYLNPFLTLLGNGKHVPAAPNAYAKLGELSAQSVWHQILNTRM
jgi:hypothetical protein